MTHSRTVRGFTLIELMVVLAVIGLLSAIIIVILTSARTDSRDAKRVADLKEVTTALQLYYDTHNTYPTVLSDLVPTYIVIEPKDPVGQQSYYYDVLGGGSGYHLGANLENPAHRALGADRDTVTDTINGSDASDCGGGSLSGRRCYDIGP
jgi:prepilin-type N-terminal cleavage/methylation domain-containing protein